MRELARRDLYFLLRYILQRPDVEHPWIFERCLEVQASPDGHLDLWAREHYKSTLITWALTIMDLLGSHGDNPLPEWQGRELCVGIFSYTRPIAKTFLRQIKREFENNVILRALFPDIIWSNPKGEAPKWSDDEGIVLKRKSNPKESTIEAWGIVDSQPTGRHFPLCIYDDVVEKTSVMTPEATRKTTDSWANSLDLIGNITDTIPGIRRYIGTRWSHNDTYREILLRGAAKERVHAITKDGTATGEPVLKTTEEVQEKRRLQGAYIFSCQQLQNPTGESALGFKKEWIQHYNNLDASALSLCIIVDPARVEKKLTADYTVINVWGRGADDNYYLVDAIRDRLNLKGRRDALFEMHRKHSTRGPLTVYYEQTGAHADTDSIREEMERQTYRFTLTPIHSSVKKENRISSLNPIFEQGRVWLPQSMVKTDSNGDQYDYVERFIHDEYLTFPLPVHDDMLDCAAWLVTEQIHLPKPNVTQPPAPAPVRQSRNSWMAA